jgi:glycosyltransferase involved in cell wall biosynthesis
MWGAAEALGIDLISARGRYWYLREGGRFKGARRFLKDRSSARALAGEIKDRGFDLVHTNTLNSPFGAMLAGELQVPHVWHMREFLSEEDGCRFLLGSSYAARFIDRTTSRIIVNSKFTWGRSTRYCPDEKIRLVYNGVLDENDQAPGPPSCRLICSERPVRLVLVGSIQPRKGQEDAILALRHLNATLTLVGDGSSEHVESLRRLASEAGVADRIEWAGFQEEPGRFYDEADIALVCSRNEPFGNVTVESMSRGLPTVGARSGGILEVIGDGVNGLLYEVGDPGSLAQQVRRLVSNFDFRGRLVEAAYESVYARFGIRRYAREIEVVYRECLSDP